MNDKKQKKEFESRTGPDYIAPKNEVFMKQSKDSETDRETDRQRQRKRQTYRDR